MIGSAMMMRNVMASRLTWIHSLRSSARSRLKEKPVIATSPCTLSRWMKTSSSRGSTSRQDRSAPAVDADGAFERGAIGAGDVQGASEHGGRLDARRAAQAPRRLVDVVAGRLEGDQPGTPRDVVGASPCTTIRPLAR